MKKLTFLFAIGAIILFSSDVKAQVNLRKSTGGSDSANQKTIQSVQTIQIGQTVPNKPASSKTKYYSIDPTAFSSSWGSHNIQKTSKEGAYIELSIGNPSRPYLVAPVNLPHNCNITGMRVIFYDVSSIQDLEAVLWQGGPNFGALDSRNLGHTKSNYSSGMVQQNLTVTGKIDNENHSYYVTVAPANNTIWPSDYGLRIKRVTIEYAEE